jgi:hypothetical protein
MALGSTQLLTEMSTRNLLGGKGLLARKANNLTAIYEPIVQKMWEQRRFITVWASNACYRDRFTFSPVTLIIIVLICKPIFPELPKFIL